MATEDELHLLHSFIHLSHKDAVGISIEPVTRTVSVNKTDINSVLRGAFSLVQEARR